MDPNKRIAAGALNLGMNFAVGFVVFCFIGGLMDRRFGTRHWILVGVFFGLCYGAYETWKIIREINKEGS